MRVGPTGAERPVVQHNDQWYGIESISTDISAEFWERDGVGRTASALAAGDLPAVDVRGLRIGPPLARPTLIVCIGMNYAAHAAESGATPPDEPVLFLKAPNTWAGPYDDVMSPPSATAVDWEVELGFVIARRVAFLSSTTDGAEAIGGYFVVNDLSERRFQLERSGGQWSKGKCLKGFAPAGPLLVTPDEFDVADARLRSWVNGEPRQDSTTADMIVDPGSLVHHLSQFMELEPGDVVLTGTPQGVALSGRFPYLRSGDVVEIEIDGLGRQQQTVVTAVTSFTSTEPLSG